MTKNTQWLYVYKRSNLKRKSRPYLRKIRNVAENKKVSIELEYFYLNVPRFNSEIKNFNADRKRLYNITGIWFRQEFHEFQV